MRSAKCWMRPQIVLAAAMTFLTGCAGVGSEVPQRTCPPIVNYSRSEQAQVAKELAALPEGALIVGWMTDYAVLRAQARSCAMPRTWLANAT